MNAASRHYSDSTRPLNSKPGPPEPDTAIQRRCWLRQLGELDVDWHLAQLENRSDLADDFAGQIQLLERKLGFR
jgi:hypothetical protein